MSGYESGVSKLSFLSSPSEKRARAMEALSDSDDDAPAHLSGYRDTVYMEVDQDDMVSHPPTSKRPKKSLRIPSSPSTFLEFLTVELKGDVPLILDKIQFLIENIEAVQSRIPDEHYLHPVLESALWTEGGSNGDSKLSFLQHLKDNLESSWTDVSKTSVSSPEMVQATPSGGVANNE